MFLGKFLRMKCANVGGLCSVEVWKGCVVCKCGGVV